MPENSWEVHEDAKGKADVWRNRRIYRYDEDSIDEAKAVCRSRAREGETLTVIPHEGRKTSFVLRNGRWVRP